jgi:hypothetical protein
MILLKSNNWSLKQYSVSSEGGQNDDDDEDDDEEEKAENNDYAHELSHSDVEVVGADQQYKLRNNIMNMNGEEKVSNSE